MAAIAKRVAAAGVAHDTRSPTQIKAITTGVRAILRYVMAWRNVAARSSALVIRASGAS